MSHPVASDEVRDQSLRRWLAARKGLVEAGMHDLPTRPADCMLAVLCVPVENIPESFRQAHREFVEATLEYVTITKDPGGRHSHSEDCLPVIETLIDEYTHRLIEMRYR